MLITRAGDYGLQGMVHLATLPKDKDAYVAEIARNCGVPASFLAKIFQNLSKVGLVRSQRGAKGGFNLARKPSEITVLEILESIEGNIYLNRCLISEDECPKRPTCNAHLVFKEAQKAIRKVLSSYTLQDLVNGQKLPTT